jgi:hypothetical protein
MDGLDARTGFLRVLPALQLTCRVVICLLRFFTFTGSHTDGYFARVFFGIIKIVRQACVVLRLERRFACAWLRNRSLGAGVSISGESLIRTKGKLCGGFAFIHAADGFGHLPP